MQVESGGAQRFAHQLRAADPRQHQLILLKGRRSDAIRRDDPLGLAVACWSIVHGLASILVEGLLDRRSLAPALDPKTLTRLVTRLLIEGLAKR